MLTNINYLYAHIISRLVRNHKNILQLLSMAFKKFYRIASLNTAILGGKLHKSFNRLLRLSIEGKLRNN